MAEWERMVRCESLPRAAGTSADGNIAEWLYKAHTSLGGYVNLFFHLSESTDSG